jgi:hypothetical protein
MYSYVAQYKFTTLLPQSSGSKSSQARNQRKAGVKYSLRVKDVHSSQIVVNFYLTTQHYILEDCTAHSHHCVDLKSEIPYIHHRMVIPRNFYHNLLTYAAFDVLKTCTNHVTFRTIRVTLTAQMNFGNIPYQYTPALLRKDRFKYSHINVSFTP